MGFIPNVYEEHEGNPWIERLAPVAVVVGVALLIFFQQFLRIESGATLITPLPEVQAYEIARKPTVGGFVVEAKVLTKVRYLMNMAHADEELPALLKEFDVFEKTAVSRVERFRVAIVATELLGTKAGIDRLESLDKEVEPNGELAAEIYWMLKRYRQVAAVEEYSRAKQEFESATQQKKAAPSRPLILKGPVPRLDSMTDDMRASLTGRHGFFGSLAIVQGPDRDEGARNELLGRYLDVVDFDIVIDNVEWLMGWIGLIAFICFVYWASQGSQIGLDDPIVPTTVYLEMFAIMALAFAVSDGVDVLLLGNNTPLAIGVGQCMMWSLPLCILWPKLRGVTWSDMRMDLGLHSGEGVIKEVGIGIACACVSMLLFNIVFWFMERWSEVAGETGALNDAPIVTPPGMYDTPDGATWGLVWLGALGSVVWAPLFEETLFRGALQRWLRVRVRPVYAILITATVFGFIHPYSVGGLVFVAISGVFYCTLREWRQCLIAPMVMHFLDNALIETRDIGFLFKLG